LWLPQTNSVNNNDDSARTRRVSPDVPALAPLFPTNDSAGRGGDDYNNSVH